MFVISVITLFVRVLQLLVSMLPKLFFNKRWVGRVGVLTLHGDCCSM